MYAVKIPYFEEVETDDNTLLPYEKDLQKMIIHEANIMSKISAYPNTGYFLTFYGLYSYKNNPVMVSELFEGYGLYHLLKVNLSEPQLLYISKVIFEQLKYLHDNGFSHGDVHNNNIMYNSTRIVLIDISNYEYDESLSDHINAEIYRTQTKYIKNVSRDILLQKKDIYDAGEVIKELSTYNQASIYDSINIIIQQCMTIDINKRPYADEILKLINSFNQ